MTRRAFLDDTRQAEIEAQGFTIVRILSEDEAAAGLERVRALQPSDGFVPPPGAHTPYHCTFLDPDRTYKRAVDDLTRELFEQRTCALLDRYTMLTSNLYVKPPGTGRFEVHQNWPVTDDIRDTTLTLWCPFVEAGPHNGTIQVVPGSHKIVPDTFTVGAPKYFASFYDDLIDHWLEPVRLRPGECILFDDSLLHWSDVNDSDETRWSAQLVFMPEERTPVIYYLDDSSDPPRFEIYEIDASFFIESGVEQLVDRPRGLRLLKTTPAHHLEIDEEEFRSLMAEGPSTRAKVYEGRAIAEAFSAALAKGRTDPSAPSAREVNDAPPPSPESRRRRWPFRT